MPWRTIPAAFLGGVLVATCVITYFVGRAVGQAVRNMG